MESLLNKVIYQVFIRNYTEEGTLKAFLPHIKEIKERTGADILYSTPVNPIGQYRKKGKLGCPYSIKDYETINPQLGSVEDFKEVVKETHKNGRKFRLDRVFNHTSRDSKLLKEHPDYFFHDKDGNINTKVPEWSDVYDLDHTNPKVEEYLVGILQKFVSYGVDGFRFDVGTRIPASFYALARKTLGDDIIFLSESVDQERINAFRQKGFTARSNGELASGGRNLFYHYNSHRYLLNYLEDFDPAELQIYKCRVNLESASIPANTSIVRAIENHDRKRIASYTDSKQIALNVLAYSFFTKGPSFVYRDEENGQKHTPSLFDKDTVEWANDKETYELYKKLVDLKHREKNKELLQTILDQGRTTSIKATNGYKDGKEEIGLFSLNPAGVAVPVEQGKYKDLISNKEIVSEGKVFVTDPRILVKED